MSKQVNNKKDGWETKLELIWEALADELLRRIKSGEAAPTDLTNARQLLRDNSITIDPNGNTEPLDMLAESLPFDSDTFAPGNEQ